MQISKTNSVIKQLYFIGSYILPVVFSLVISFNPACSQSKNGVWQSDLGNGFYKNPIIYADYSDPDAIRVGNDYYMTASSFNCIPGLPILHSKDLVNWVVINHALKKQLPEELYSRPQHGKGVWAPSLIFRKGEYRIYYPDPDFGIYMVKATDPAGVWEKPVLVMPGKGIIDPSTFWDDDGKAYLAVAWAASRAGVNSLLTLFEMNADGTAVISEGKNIYDGHGANHTVEGPKFYKRNGYYYIFAPAGGVATGWQLVLRSKQIYGPFEEKKVMDQGKSSINGPHQGALVQTPKGEDWFLHFQDKGTYGRIVHLQPVFWKDGWPLIGLDKDGDGVGEPVDTYAKPDVGKKYPIVSTTESDEFHNGTPNLQWQWHANPKIQWTSGIAGTDFLRLFNYASVKADENLWNVPNLLLQKFPAPSFTATTKVNLVTEWDVWQEKKAGLLIMGNDYSYLSISKDSKGYKLHQTTCLNAALGSVEQVQEVASLKSSTAYLRVHVSAPAAICTFSFSEDGINFKPIGKPFNAQPDKWIGAKVGLFSISSPDVRVGGYADFDWFSVEK